MSIKGYLRQKARSQRYGKLAKPERVEAEPETPNLFGAAALVDYFPEIDS